MDERTEDFATNCKPCIFAQFEDNNQIGCDLNRLEKYIENDKAEKTEEGHYIIKTVCNTCRGEVWANYNLGRNLIAKVEEEIRVVISFILVSINDSVDFIKKELPVSIQRCVNQSQIKPKQIILVVKNQEIDYHEIDEILKDCCSDIEYKIVRIISEETDIGKYIDLGVQKCTSRYYAVYHVGNNIPTNLIQTINNVINNKMEPLSMVQPSCTNYSGMVMQTYLHKIFGGNKDFPIYQKIQEASEIQNKQSYVYTRERLWAT